MPKRVQLSGWQYQVTAQVSENRLNRSMFSVASTFGTIPLPSELSDRIVLEVVCSYSSRHPSMQWAEEFASISPQWKRVIDTHRDRLPRLLVDTVKASGRHLEILMPSNEPQSSSGGLPRPVMLYGQADKLATMLRRLAARSMVISLGKVIVKWPVFNRRFRRSWVARGSSCARGP